MRRMAYSSAGVRHFGRSTNWQKKVPRNCTGAQTIREILLSELQMASQASKCEQVMYIDRNSIVTNRNISKLVPAKSRVTTKIGHMLFVQVYYTITFINNSNTHLI